MQWQHIAHSCKFKTLQVWACSSFQTRSSCNQAKQKSCDILQARTHRWIRHCGSSSAQEPLDSKMGDSLGFCGGPEMRPLHLTCWLSWTAGRIIQIPWTLACSWLAQLHVYQSSILCKICISPPLKLLLQPQGCTAMDFSGPVMVDCFSWRNISGFFWTSGRCCFLEE